MAQERPLIAAQMTGPGRREGLARGLEEGLKQGREEGLKAAHAERKQQLATLEQNWSKALEEFNGVRDQMVIEAREDVLKLAVRMGDGFHIQFVQIAADLLRGGWRIFDDQRAVYETPLWCNRGVQRS